MTTLRFRQTRNVSFSEFVNDFPFLNSLKDKEYQVDDNIEEDLIDEVYELINFSTIVCDGGKISLCPRAKNTETFPIIDIGNGEFVVIDLQPDVEEFQPDPTSRFKDGDKITIQNNPDFFNALFRIRFGIFSNEKIFCNAIEYF